MTSDGDESICPHLMRIPLRNRCRADLRMAISSGCQASELASITIFRGTLGIIYLETTTNVNNARHKLIMRHMQEQFRPQWQSLRLRHELELREARSRARKTNNIAAMLPAEAACYISHTKALVLARAKCIAAAYSAYNESSGREANLELTDFYATVVAARRSAFEAGSKRRRAADGPPGTQLTLLLRGFEHETRPALLEGQAVLGIQRVQMENMFKISVRTKYLVDTCVFNWLTDSKIQKQSLPSDGGFAIIHIQLDEINRTADQERRAKLLLMQTSLRCELVPTQTFLADISRSDHARWGDGKLFQSIKADLDRLNGGKENNSRDALIAEASIANGYTLLTADKDLRSATMQHNGRVIFYSPAST